VPELPTGTITLLVTDIEGSTGLWERYPQTMPAAMDRHDTILREAIASGGGAVFRTVGDAFFAAFPTAAGALQTALDVQRGLFAEPWGAFFAAPAPQPRAPAAQPRIAVRMALHTSQVELRDGEYFGPPLNRVARLLSAGHGGQTLLCHNTAALVREILPPGVELRDMGAHRLKDLRQPIHIFQLVVDGLPADFAPLKTLTTAAAQPSRATAFHQAKLPGMPGVDYDALWRQEQDRQRQRRSKKGKKAGDEGELF
jgi:class 3 adenylate cyclase